METVIKIAGLCLAVSILISLLRKDAPEMGLLLSVGAALLGGYLLFDGVLEAARLGDELVDLTGLAPATFTPLLKVTAIASVSRVGAALCADAGQSALARVMEISGALCALGCAVPLIQALVDVIFGFL